MISTIAGKVTATGSDSVILDVQGIGFEIAIPKTFLKAGVFHLQQIQSVPISRLQGKIGDLTKEELQRVRSKLSELLYLGGS